MSIETYLLSVGCLRNMRQESGLFHIVRPPWSQLYVFQAAILAATSKIRIHHQVKSKQPPDDDMLSTETVRTL